LHAQNAGEASEPRSPGATEAVFDIADVARAEVRAEGELFLRELRVKACLAKPGTEGGLVLEVELLRRPAHRDSQ